jgi:hypothetical protein
MPANRRSEYSSVNEMKSALFFRTHKDRVVPDPFTETFSAICYLGRGVSTGSASTSAGLRITFMLASLATTQIHFIDISIGSDIEFLRHSHTANPARLALASCAKAAIEEHENVAAGRHNQPCTGHTCTRSGL